jgi:hypothetical protein
MRASQQIFGALLLVGATYFAMKRIADAKNETAVGGPVFALDERHPAELEAFRILTRRVEAMGQPALAGRLERLHERGEMWVGASMGPQRWAVFVDSLALVRRIYIRRAALLDPVAHLFSTPRPDIPEGFQRTFAWISLAGALRHEVAHRDGVEEEAPAYDLEIAWYEQVRSSPFVANLADGERRAWDWALESAIRSAQKARETATRGAAASP